MIQFNASNFIMDVCDSCQRLHVTTEARTYLGDKITITAHLDVDDMARSLMNLPAFAFEAAALLAQKPLERACKEV